MPITVGYEPVAALGSGAYGAGYGQYQKWIQEQQQQERMQQQQLASQAQRQAEQIQAQQAHDQFQAQQSAQDFQRQQQTARDNEQYAYTTKQQRDLSDLQDQTHTIMSSDALSPEEKQYALKQLAYKSAQIQPMPQFKPHDQGRVEYNYDKGFATIYGPNGQVDIKPIPQQKQQTSDVQVDPETGVATYYDQNNNAINQKQVFKIPGPAKDEISAHDLARLYTQANKDLSVDNPQFGEVGHKDEPQFFPPTQEAKDAYVKNIVEQHQKITGRYPSQTKVSEINQQAAQEYQQERNPNAIPAETLSQQGPPAPPQQQFKSTLPFPVVRSAAEAMQLPPGTPFLTPDGRPKVR